MDNDNIKNDKSFLKDGMTSKEIQRIVQNIRDYMGLKQSMSYDDKVKKLKEDHQTFYDRYPMLFDMSTKDDFSYDNLYFFLQMRDFSYSEVPGSIFLYLSQAEQIF